MFGLQFAPRHAIKSQELIDIIAEWTPVPDVKHSEEAVILAADDNKPWMLEY